MKLNQANVVLGVSKKWAERAEAQPWLSVCACAGILRCGVTTNICRKTQGRSREGCMKRGAIDIRKQSWLQFTEWAAAAIAELEQEAKATRKAETERIRSGLQEGTDSVGMISGCSC